MARRISVEDGNSARNQFGIVQPQTMQENVDGLDATPPGTPMSDWVLHSMSDASSCFDFMSESAGIISDSDWEELAIHDT